MPEFRVIQGGADSKAKRKSVAGSKRVTEEQKKAADAVQGVVTPSSDEVAPAKEAPTPRGGKATGLTICLAVASALLLAILLGFAGYRWLYGNDGQDIQGSWYVNGTEAIMTFTEDEIILNDEVSYTYAINGADKTISFEFNDLSGQGSYRFSLDRGELAIIDGEVSAFDTLKADFSWLMGALIHFMKGEEASPALADSENVTLLTRVPDAPVEGEGAVEGEAEAPAEGEGDASAEGDATAEGEPAVEGEAGGEGAGEGATEPPAADAGSQDNSASDAGPGFNEFAQDPGSTPADVTSLTVSDVVKG